MSLTLTYQYGLYIGGPPLYIRNPSLYIMGLSGEVSASSMIMSALPKQLMLPQVMILAHAGHGQLKKQNALIDYIILFILASANE
jgi:hypothetical protein